MFAASITPVPVMGVNSQAFVVVLLEGNPRRRPWLEKW